MSNSSTGFLKVSFSLDICCFFTYFQPTPYTWLFSDECFCLKPLKTDLWIIRAQKRHLTQGKPVLCLHNRQLNKETFLHCIFRNFVTSSLPQKHNEQRQIKHSLAGIKYYFFKQQVDSQRALSSKVHISGYGVHSVLKKLRKLEKWRKKEKMVGPKNIYSRWTVYLLYCKIYQKKPKQQQQQPTNRKTKNKWRVLKKAKLNLS